MDKKKAAPARTYEICLEGHLASHWGHWFDGFTISLQENGRTLLIGSVVDQAALHGLLRKVRDLGLPLLSVVCVDPHAKGVQNEDDDKQ